MAEKKKREYGGDGIVVSYEVGRCIHARQCVRGLPEVFDPDKRPWVDPDRARPDRVAEVVLRCPTGALRFRRTDGGAEEAAAHLNSVAVEPDGPLYLRGELELGLPGGEVLEETRVGLCRCGRSQNKPFCDDSHLEAGFRDPGLLGASRLEPGAGAERAGPLEISPAPNGPLLLKGPFTLESGDGGGSVHGEKAALCRCGGSGNKPFCDGTHKQIGFQAD